jgi:hypothetical protein
MRFWVAIVMVAACSSDSDVMISGPGSGGCGNSGGQDWSFMSTEYAPHISTEEIYMRYLQTGATGLYVSNLRFAGAISNIGYVTANIHPNQGDSTTLAATFAKPAPADPTCEWDAIGPYWPDAPK